MLDKSIPYMNLIMRRKSNGIAPITGLANDYKFVPYTPGLEKDWAEIVTAVGEFDSTSEALAYFEEMYLSNLAEAHRRVIFIETKDHKRIVTATSWWCHTNNRRDATLEWIAVLPEYQNRGLGKAVVSEGVRNMIALEGDVDIYLHTQTWSYRAIGIYLQLGFEFLETETFGNNENDYHMALPILKEKMMNRI